MLIALLFEKIYKHSCLLYMNYFSAIFIFPDNTKARYVKLHSLWDERDLNYPPHEAPQCGRPHHNCLNRTGHEPVPALDFLLRQFYSCSL